MESQREQPELQKVFFFIRWQLFSIVLSLPGHLAFIFRGRRRSRCGSFNRIVLVARLIWIHLAVPCMHAPLELLHIVEEIIELRDTIPGAIVECGAYLGGSSAKLSHAASFSGRRLVVCDSFEGLPEVRSKDQVAGKRNFCAGEYSARLGQVRQNVQRYGKPEIVDFVPGWYDVSLARLKGTPISCLFLDVDLEASVKTCLEALWPSVEPGCKVFIHDVDRPPLREPFYDELWWSTHIGLSLPHCVGFEDGLGWQKRLLGYAVKPYPISRNAL